MHGSRLSPISLRSYEIESHSHSHDFAQLVLPLKGVMELQTGSQTGLVHKSTGAFIAPNETHCFSASSGNLFLVVDLKQQHLPSQLNRTPSFLALSTTLNQFLLFAHSYLLQKEKDLHADYLVQTLLLKLLPSNLLTEYDPISLRAKQWIDQYFALPVDLSKLTQFCHLSLSQLQRRFKRTTGQTLAEYWRAKKLEQAQMLLSKESLTIEAIAAQLGYENLSAFSRRFSQSFDLSPSQWREMALSAKRMREEDKN